MRAGAAHRRRQAQAGRPVHGHPAPLARSRLSDRPGRRAHADQPGGVPARRRAGRQGRSPAAGGAGQVLRRHRPRRDPAGPVPDQQRDLGQARRRRRRHGDGRRTRRGVRHGPVPHLHRRRADGHAAQGPAVRLEADGREQLHRPVGARQAEAAPHRADRPVRRPDVRPPGVPGHRRRAAHPRGVGPVPGVHPAGQAGAAGGRAARPQGVRRAVGAEVGRTLADSHRGQRHQPEGHAPVLHLAPGQDRPQRADRRVGAGTPERQRRHLPERRHQLLPATSGTSSR